MHQLSVVNTEQLPYKSDIADFGFEEALSILDRPNISGSLNKALFMERMSNSGKGETFGFKSLDDLTYMPSSGLVIVHGRTGHGKSLFMMNIALRKILEGRKVVYYSLEMDPTRCFLRFVQMHDGRVLSSHPFHNTQRYIEEIKKGNDKAEDIFSKLEDTFFLSYSSTDVSQLISEIEQSELTNSIVFIDYVQLLSLRSPEGSRQQELANIVNMLRDTAVRNNLLIITGAQVTQNASRTPLEDYVRESRDIDNAAELVLRVWNRNCEPDSMDNRLFCHENTDFIIDIKKNRNGIPGGRTGFKLINGLIMKDNKERNSQ